MTYVDGMVAAVPMENREKYRLFAEDMAVIFKEYGAQKLVDCWGDDLPAGEVTSFPLSVKCKENEAVVFAWITWPSRETRDAAWEKIMADPRMQSQQMPFDGKRMIHGGFEMIVDA